MGCFYSLFDKVKMYKCYIFYTLPESPGNTDERCTLLKCAICNKILLYVKVYLTEFDRKNYNYVIAFILKAELHYKNEHS